MISFDKTDESVVVTCDDCGDAWASAHSTLDAAARASIAHEHNVHRISPAKTRGYSALYNKSRGSRRMTEL